VRCGLAGAIISVPLAHTARSHTGQSLPPETPDEHTFPQKLREPSLAFSRALRVRSATPPKRRIRVAEAVDSINAPSNANASSPSEISNPVADSQPAQPLPFNDTQRQASTSRRSSSVHPARRVRHRVPVSTAIPSADLLKSLEAQNSPYASTLRKKLTPRHTGQHGTVADRHSAHQDDEQRREAAELRAEEDRATQRDGYDPALVLQTDSRRRQVRLNPVQREMVWTARQQQYHSLLQRIVACLQSHRSPVEKCQTLFALHDEVIRHHLRLRADTYEDVFHTLYSVGVRRGGGAGQPGKASLAASAQLVSGNSLWESDLSGHEAARVSGGSLPAELASAAAASSTVLSAHGMEHVWEMYRYSVDSGTNPTARMLQYVMGLLEHASVALAVSRAPSTQTDTAHLDGNRSSSHRARSSGLLLVEAKAHSLMMDADRYHLTPSEYTINSYIGVCEACDVMHLAVARVTDYQTRHERQPSAGMYARLITGLVRCGHYKDAMAVVTTMQNVPMSVYLLNAVLQAARHSSDPASAFTFYRSLFFTPSSPLHVDGGSARREGQQRRLEPPARSSIRLIPSLVTFSILVEVMQVTRSCAELDFVLAEMRHYRTKGNGMLLNNLLKLMEDSGAPEQQRDALRCAMESKHIRVFDENRGPGNLSVTP
jgi:hypothetical protein